MTDTTPDSGTPSTHLSGGLASRKVGGVPVKWLVLIAVLALLGAYLWRKYRGNKASSTAVTDTATGGVDAGAAITDWGGNNTPNLPGAGGIGATSYNPTTGAGVTTNSAWETLAINGLIGSGAGNAADITTALNAALTGTALTPAQEQIYNLAVSTYGAPPQNISSIVLAAPTTTQSTPPAAQRTLTRYVRYKSGLIAAQYSDGSEVGFPSLAAYKAAGSPKFTQLKY